MFEIVKRGFLKSEKKLKNKRLALFWALFIPKRKNSVFIL